MKIKEKLTFSTALTLSTLAVVLCLPFQAHGEKSEVTVSEPSSTWELRTPDNIPAGPKNAAVVYKSVHETVYAACPLYVRNGPGSQYDYLGLLSKGDPVCRGAIGNNGWSQILYKGREAYVNTIHLSVSPILPETPDPGSEAQYQALNDSVKAICVTKLRRGPGGQYAVIGHLTQGSGALRMAAGKNGWSQLLFHDTIAYACTADLTSGSLSGDPLWQEETRELYLTAGTALWAGPGHDSRVLGSLARGTAVQAQAASSEGWTRILYQDQPAYVPTAYLSSESGTIFPAVETSHAELPTPNAPFIYQYMAPEGIMPHAFFTPTEADLSKSLPLIISLHGALEIGEAPNTLKHNFITREFLNWEYTGLQGFDAYIVCPQLTGFGYGTTWRDPEVADKFFSLIDYLKKTCNIDENKIILEGHSLGGEGVFYMGADPRACFSALVPISAYNPYVDISSIHCAVRGYTGSPYLPAPREDWDSYNFMVKSFSDYWGLENYSMKNCSHYDIPMVAFEEDLNEDGKSDLISWMLEQ